MGGYYVKGMIVVYLCNVGCCESYSIYIGDFEVFEWYWVLFEGFVGYMMFFFWDEVLVFVIVFYVYVFVVMVVFFEVVGVGVYFGLLFLKIVWFMFDMLCFFVVDVFEEVVCWLEV